MGLSIVKSKLIESLHNIILVILKGIFNNIDGWIAQIVVFFLFLRLLKIIVKVCKIGKLTQGEAYECCVDWLDRDQESKVCLIGVN